MSGCATSSQGVVLTDSTGIYPNAAATSKITNNALQKGTKVYLGRTVSGYAGQPYIGVSTLDCSQSGFVAKWAIQVTGSAPVPAAATSACATPTRGTLNSNVALYADASATASVYGKGTLSKGTQVYLGRTIIGYGGQAYIGVSTLDCAQTGFVAKSAIQVQGASSSKPPATPPRSPSMSNCATSTQGTIVGARGATVYANHNNIVGGGIQGALQAGTRVNVGRTVAGSDGQQYTGISTLDCAMQGFVLTPSVQIQGSSSPSCATSTTATIQQQTVVYSGQSMYSTVKGTLPRGTKVFTGRKATGGDGQQYIGASAMDCSISGWVLASALASGAAGCATSSQGTVINGAPVPVLGTPGNAWSNKGQFASGTRVYTGRTVTANGQQYVGASALDCSLSGWVPSATVHLDSAPATAPAAYVAPAGSGYYISGSPAHAYLRGSNKDLGLLVNTNQTVKPINGGRLWALYNLNPDGTLSFVGSYGSVPGAPAPPNAQANNVPAQYYPPPAPPPPPAPVYYAPPPPPPPAPTYYAPQPAPVAYYPQPAPVAVQPAYYPPVIDPMSGIPQVAGVPAYDPTQAALYAGAAYGAEAAAGSQAQTAGQAIDPSTGYGGIDPSTGLPIGYSSAYGGIDPSTGLPVGMDPLTASILMGGGTGGIDDLSGMSGGLDPTTLAMLSGGDPDDAYAMAMQNGGYDPTGGLMGGY